MNDAASSPSSNPPAAEPPLDAARAARKNYCLSILNGVFFNVGEAFIDPSTVIALMVTRLTRLATVVGFATSQWEIGWFLPQILTVHFLETRRRRLPLYTAMAVLRVVGLVTSTLAIILLGDRNPTATLVIFLAANTLYALSGGFAAVSFYDVIGRTVPFAWHARMWAYRLFFGGLLSAAAGFAIRAILALPDFSLRFGLLFAIATVLIGIGTGLFSLCDEPPVEVSRKALHLGEHLRENLEVAWRDPSFRALYGTRVALACAAIATPFYVFFAIRTLGLPGSVVAAFVSARIAGFVLANPLWQRVATKRGHRALMRVVSVMAGLAPVLAILAAFAPRALATPALIAAFVLLGATVSGTNIAFQSLLLAIAPAARRPSYVGLMNSFLGPVMILPVFGGVLVDVTSPVALFTLAAVCAAVAWRLAQRLPATLGAEAAGPPGHEGEPGIA
jgi:MFS family permease